MFKKKDGEYLCVVALPSDSPECDCHPDFFRVLGVFRAASEMLSSNILSSTIHHGGQQPISL